jgi:hypothetical protein
MYELWRDIIFYSLDLKKKNGYLINFGKFVEF